MFTMTYDLETETFTLTGVSSNAWAHICSALLSVLEKAERVGFDSYVAELRELLDALNAHEPIRLAMEAAPLDVLLASIRTDNPTYAAERPMEPPMTLAQYQNTSNHGTPLSWTFTPHDGGEPVDLTDRIGMPA